MILNKTETPNPIEFEDDVTGPQGARFVLYPVKGVHTEEDVRKARLWIRFNRDVVSMQIRWKNAGDDKPPPDKFPDFLIIKNLKKEIGELKSYIEELEYKLQKEETAQIKQLKKDIQREKLYKDLNSQLAQARKEITKLRETVSDLITKLNAKKNEH